MPFLSAAELQKTDRILFIAHLALGDFTYLQTELRAFKAAYPHIRVDLWVDEVRRTADESRWSVLKQYVLFDWVKECEFLGRLFLDTYSPDAFAESRRLARAEQYPLVISLATLRPWLYAKLARDIAQDGKAIGMWRWTAAACWHLPARFRLSRAINPWRTDRVDGPHISDYYADWFGQIAGLSISKAERMPRLDISMHWQHDAQQRIDQWGWSGKRLIFINPYAKTHKRCWSLTQVMDLIRSMQSQSAYRDAGYILNAMPHQIAEASAALTSAGLPGCQIFSATENFFQLPALLARCQMIISVETAVMHLANAVQVPVIALMRQKNPEWVPLDAERSIVITAPGKRDWVNKIPVADVLAQLARFEQRFAAVSGTSFSA